MAEKLTLESLQERIATLEQRLNTSSIKPKTELDVKREELQALYIQRGNAKSSIDPKAEWNKERKEPISESDYVRGLILEKQSELKELEVKIKPEKVLVTNQNMGGL